MLHNTKIGFVLILRYIKTSLELLQPGGRILHQAFVYDTKERPKEQGIIKTLFA